MNDSSSKAWAVRRMIRLQQHYTRYPLTNHVKVRRQVIQIATTVLAFKISPP